MNMPIARPRLAMLLSCWKEIKHKIVAGETGDPAPPTHTHTFKMDVKHIAMFAVETHTHTQYTLTPQHTLSLEKELPHLSSCFKKASKGI